MNLWQLHDNHFNWDECWWLLVWAWGKDEALQIAVDRYEYPRELKQSGASAEEYFGCDLMHYVTSRPEKEFPHVERRCVVQREAGWREEYETQCEVCELYANGIDEYYVCLGCNVCRECRDLNEYEPCGCGES